MGTIPGQAVACELYPGADVTPDELEFLMAVERYQRLHGRRYPTWREVLFVARCLGYRKIARSIPIPGPRDLPAPPPYPVPGDPPETVKALGEPGTPATG